MSNISSILLFLLNCAMIRSMKRSTPAVATLAAALSFSGFAQSTQAQQFGVCIAAPSGLVAWWPGDTNENDIVGGHNPSAVSAVNLVPGEVLNGFRFGSLGYMQIPQAPALQNQRFTLSAWARPDGPGLENDQNGSVIINQAVNGSNFLQLSWSDTSGSFVFSFGDDATEFIVSRDAFPRGVFHLVNGTYDGSAFRLFVNGVEQGSKVESRPVTYSTTDWRIGGNPITTVFARTWNGVLDELQIFNRALSQAEIQAIFNAGTAGQCKVASIALGGVVSASAFGGFTSISPGSWVEIFGNSLAATTRSWADADFKGVNAPTSLDGTSVTIGGKSAFVDFISPGQVNALIPSDTPIGPQQMTVTTALGTSAAYNIMVNAVQPGLLAPPSFAVGGKQYAVALFADGTYVLPVGAIAGISSRPARPGETIILYGVGFGPVTPNIPAGQLEQQSNALASSLRISIGGVTALTSYAGLAPSFTGLYQFNITVPAAASGAAPLTFSLGGTSGTQTLFIAVGN
jgi:uncharacterized protein (TIGR03437 family)